MVKYVDIDFETTSARDLKVCGSSVYSEDPTTEILCLTYQVLPDPTLYRWIPGGYGAGLQALIDDPDVIFFAHNAGFEKDIWRNIMVPVFGFVNIPNSRWEDTMAVCAMKSLPLDLEGACHVMGLEYRKDTEGSALVKSLSKPNKKDFYITLTPAIRSRVYEYNASDIRATTGLFDAVGPLPWAERQVWLLDQRINERGIMLDKGYIRAAQSVVDGATSPLLREFRDLTGVNPGQVAKVKEWMHAEGLDLKDLRKETLAKLLGGAEEGEDDEDDYIEYKGEEVDLPSNVRRALEIRQTLGSASIKKLGRMLSCVCADGRARRTVQYHAAGTGRWGGRLFQPHNFPRGTIKIKGWDSKTGVCVEKPPSPAMVVDAIMTGDAAYVQAVLGNPIQVVAGGLRHAIIPARGRRLVAGDFAGIEARVCLAIAGQHDKTALMSSGVDVYCDMAEAIYSRPITKNDVVERTIGKNSVLGLGFQMGWKTFRSRYAPDMPEEECKRIVEVYRKEWAPLVPKLWWGLEKAALYTVLDRTPHVAYGVLYQLEGSWLTCTLPSGRKLWYRHPQKCRRAMPWDHTDIRDGWQFTARKNGRDKIMQAFGGLLTENYISAFSRDLMVAAMFKCEEANLPIVLTVHDEIVTEPEERYADPLALQEIMVDTPEWTKQFQVPISVEAWAGGRYKK